MQATIWRDRIDILGASLVNDRWTPLLDELKAEHVPAFTPNGERMVVVISPAGRIDAFIYRTVEMSDDEVIHVLGKYGIPATVGEEGNQP